jgi:Flp pilus assembly protein TadB
MEPGQDPSDDLRVPGTAGAPADTREGQQALRLHSGIAVIALVLCAFVAVVFFWLGSPLLGAIFAVLALACAGVLVWARRVKHRGQARRR